MKKIKIKRWLSLLLCVLLSVGVLPTTAFAADGTEPIVVIGTSDGKGVELNAATPYYVNGASAANSEEPANWNAYFNAANRTLYLNGLQVEGYYQYHQNYFWTTALYSNRDLTISLSGENRLKNTAASSESVASSYYGLQLWSDDENTSGQNYKLAITSDSNGSLNVSGPDQVQQNNAGIVCFSLEINGNAKVKAWAGESTRSYSFGIIGRSLSVSENASLEATSSDALNENNGRSNGISLQYSLTSAVVVTDNAHVKASSGASGSNVNSGIYTGTLNVSGNGVVEAYGNKGKTSAGIYARGGKVQIEDNASVYAVAKEAQRQQSYGIYSSSSQQSPTVLTGGSLTAVGELLAVYTYPVDLTNYTGAYSVIASRKTDGSDPVVYNPNQSYKYLNITPHTHQWSTQWSSDETCHWHECTTANCPVTDNSQKEGYAAHAYDQEVVSDTYKASAATCTQAATYYYSCVCGAKGTETFTSGQAADHNWGNWQSNGNGTHKRTCQNCTATQTENCTGGTATCTSKATCSACNAEYGETDPNNHTGIVVWVQTATTHKQEYSCCHAEVRAEEKHNWENEKCTICQYPCVHEGGVATCTQNPSDGNTVKYQYSNWRQSDRRNNLP